MEASDVVAPLYDAYDGRLRVYWPDDLYLVGSELVLARLRRAIDRALKQGAGECLGVNSDEARRRIIVVKLEPAPVKAAPELVTTAQHSTQHPSIVTLFDRKHAE